MANIDWISHVSLQSEVKFSCSQNHPWFNSITLGDRFGLLWGFPWSSNGLLVFAVKWCQTSPVQTGVSGIEVTRDLQERQAEFSHSVADVLLW